MKQLRTTLLFLMLFVFSSALAQTDYLSDFEDTGMPVDTFYNGSDLAGSFTNGSILFPCVYNPSYGGYWESGFAYSSMRDSSDGSYANMYSARPATGANGTATYGIGQQGSAFTISGMPADNGLCTVHGLYLTNGTYGDYSMSNGDAFAKKFGGATGDDPDWFKLTIRGWLHGALKADSVEFYLADYRFSDNSQDYIVRDWQWVSLDTLGRVDSVQFSLSSSDNGAYGMNTPPFFFFDELQALEWAPESIQEAEDHLANIFPNPSSGALNLEIIQASGFNRCELFDLNGRLLRSEELNGHAHQQIDVSELQNGMYLIRLSGTASPYVQSFIKN